MTPKIATCCYCGARAALRLDGARHELACAGCGAPLHEMKALRADHGPAVGQAPGIVKPSKIRGKRRKKRGRKSTGRKLLAEAWDLIEDILD